jgi:hypothetical protein
MSPLEHAGLLEKLGKPRGRPGRGRQRRVKSFPLPGAQPDALAVGQSFLGAGEGTLQDEFADGAVRGDRGDLGLMTRTIEPLSYLVSRDNVVEIRRRLGAPSGD